MFNLLHLFFISGIFESRVELNINVHQIFMEKYIGKVTHFFNKAGVMVVGLRAKVSVGDRIKVQRGQEEFEQTVDSMQIEHEDVKTGGEGEEVAIKVERPVKEGDQVYKVEE